MVRKWKWYLLTSIDTSWDRSVLSKNPLFQATTALDTPHTMARPFLGSTAEVVTKPRYLQILK